ncbi:MAG: aspartyl protease family protein [Gammaproteobacteria bacterium]|nr:aspartyl protease family protein [Gammaproteobacteria bacterium]
MNCQYSVLRVLMLASIIISANAPGLADEPVAEPGQLEFAGASLTLPMTEQDGHPKVNVDLGDGEEHIFIVDTGASVNVIDAAIAESLDFEVVGEMQIGAPGGPQIPGNIVRAPLAHVGGATIKDAGFVTMDLASFSGGTTQGILGLGLFRDYLLTYDYRRNAIRVSRDSLSAGQPGVMPYNDHDGHIQVDMDVAGTSLATHVDTGSMVGFTLPIEMKESLALKPAGQGAAKARLVGGDRDVQFGQLDGDIQFAGSRYEDPTVGFMDPSPGYGNVGSRVLGDFVVSIDQKNHLIRFEKSTGKKVAAAGGGPRRLGVQFRGMPGGSVLTIGYVEPGSLGEKSGLLPGDVLLKLNGKPGEEYDIGSLGALIRSAEPLHLEVDRDGQTQIIEVQ